MSCSTDKHITPKLVSSNRKYTIGKQKKKISTAMKTEIKPTHFNSSHVYETIEGILF